MDYSDPSSRYAHRCTTKKRDLPRVPMDKKSMLVSPSIFFFKFWKDPEKNKSPDLQRDHAALISRCVSPKSPIAWFLGALNSTRGGEPSKLKKSGYWRCDFVVTTFQDLLLIRKSDLGTERRVSVLGG